MTTDRAIMTIALDESEAASHQATRQWWSVVTSLLVLAVFSEAVFAGAMLSGIEWARGAHAATAVALFASTITAGVVGIVTLRRVPNGMRLALTLLGLAAIIVIQAALGIMTAKGANLLWLHIPLGTALVGFAGHAAASARRLGEP